jgi:hypothetical protein
LLSWLIVSLAFSTSPFPIPHSDFVYAEVPQLITYQGRLSEANGEPITGEHTIIFRLYDAEQSGTKVWEETHTISVAKGDNGIFSVVLGSVTLLSGLNLNQPLWLTFAIDGDSEMTPRQRVTSVTYAINADTLDGLDSTKFVRVDAASGAAFVDVTTTGTTSTTNANSGLEAGTDGLRLLGGCSANQVLKWNAGSNRWECSSDTDTDTNAGGTVTSVGSGDGLTGGPITAAGALAVDVATTGTTSTTNANSGLEAGTDGLRLVGGCSANQILKWNAGSGVWECNSDANSGGTVSSVIAGTGLSGGTVTTVGTISLSTPVSVPNGGTGASSFTSGQLLTGQGTSAVATTSVGSGLQIASGKLSVTCLPIGSSESEDQNNNFQLVWPVPVAGSLSQFTVAVGSAPGSGKSWSVTGSGGSATLSCTISGTATSCTATGSATFSAGNVLTVAFARSGGGINDTEGSGWSACLIPD